VAKDCASSSGQANFVVLMKTKQNGANAQKKVKVITQDQSIQCQPNVNGKISCEVNGQNVNSAGQEESVEFNNAQNTDVTIHCEQAGISVRFNGRKVWIKLSGQYKNAQCGLCGNYNDVADDEWRMGNGQMAQDLAQFHRAYSVKGAYGDNEQDQQCSEAELDNFYSKYEKAIRSGQTPFSDDEQQYDDEDQDEEQFGGEMGSYWTQQQQNGFGNSQWQRYSVADSHIHRPVLQTMVTENMRSVCFSAGPVKQCPHGTVPIDNGSDEDNDEQQTENNKKDQQQKKMRFFCLSRESPETRRLHRQARRGEDISAQLEGRGFSYVETVIEPNQCRRF
jgi:hypothetical protein